MRAARHNLPPQEHYLFVAGITGGLPGVAVTADPLDMDVQDDVDTVIEGALA